MSLQARVALPPRGLVSTSQWDGNDKSNTGSKYDANRHGDTMMPNVRQIGAALIDHASGYGVLVRSAATEYVCELTRRTRVAVLGLILSVGALVFASVWIMFAIWHLPQRHAVAASILFALLAGSYACTRSAGRAGKPLQTVEALRRELARDRTLLDDVLGSKP